MHDGLRGMHPQPARAQRHPSLALWELKQDSELLLQGEPAEGVNDVHFHPVEPRALRATLALTD